MVNWKSVGLISVGMIAGFCLGLFYRSAPEVHTDEDKRALEKVLDSTQSDEPLSGSKDATPPQPRDNSAAQPIGSPPPQLNSGNTSRAGRHSKIQRSRIERLDNVRDLENFVKETRVDNLWESIRTARPFDRMNESINQINGRFRGQVRFPGEPGKYWEMAVETNLRIENKKLVGEARIDLSEHGKVFSSLSGNGVQSEHFKLAADGLGLLVKASPDSYFLIYYVPRLDAFVGNYYKQTSLDQVVPKGTVQLDRG